MAIAKHRTIKNTCEFSGIGLHCGSENKIICRPAKEGTGLQFHKDGNSLKVSTDHVKSTNRGTVLRNEKFAVHTIEHLLAALHALSITDLNIDIEGDEIPILDGSSKLFYDELVACEFTELNDNQDQIRILKELEFKDEETGSHYKIYPSENFELEVDIEYADPVIGHQTASLKSIHDFGKEISASRTFVLASELQQLYKANLIRGGNKNNALVFKDTGMKNSEVLEIKTKMGIGKEVKANGKVLNGLKMYFENEPARHKLLDLIGDLFLLGQTIQAKIKATKPGHTSNLKLAKFLKAYHLSNDVNSQGMYDVNSPSVKNVTEIQHILPHRYPFLMVDKIIELNEKKVVGVKNVTINEGIFQGHFPGNPVFPGVLQMEALAQCGGILALHGKEGDWDTYFVKMDGVKFRNMVYPGDSMILEMELLMPIRRGIVKMYGKVFVGDKLMSEGELTAKIVKREE